MGTKSFSGVFKEGQTEGIFGGQKRGHIRRANKEGKGGHKEGKTRNCNLPKNLLKKGLKKVTLNKITQKRTLKSCFKS